MVRYKKHISIFEITAAIVIGGVLLVAAVSQIFYGSDLTLLMAILTCCGFLYAFLLLTPIAYGFEETELVLVNPKPMQNKRIRYADVIYIDTVGSFLLSKKDFDTVEVILTYQLANGWKKTVSCHPKNVTDFVKTLHERCPNIVQDMD